MLQASALDPRYKELRFLPSGQRSGVYADLQVAASSLRAAGDVDDQPHPQRHKGESGHDIPP